MITALIYLFNGVVLMILAVRSLNNYRKSAQNFIAKGFASFGFLVAISYFLLVIDIFLASRGMQRASVLADTLATLLIYLGMFPTIQMASRFTRTPLLGRILMVLIAVSGAYVIWLNAQFAQTTFISEQGIATYVDESIGSTLFGLTILGVYTWVFVAFIWAGTQNQHIRAKLYTLGVGFLAATWSAAALASAPRTFNQYLIGYAVLFVSYIIQLVGTLMGSDKAQ